MSPGGPGRRLSTEATLPRALAVLCCAAGLSALASAAASPEVHEVLVVRALEGASVEALVVLGPPPGVVRRGRGTTYRAGDDVQLVAHPLPPGRLQASFTLVSGEGPACVGVVSARVVLSVEGSQGRRAVAEAAKVTGCEVPRRRASLWALRGEHPHAVFVDGVSIRRDEIGQAEEAAKAAFRDAPEDLEVESAIRLGQDAVYLLSAFSSREVKVVVRSGGALRPGKSPLTL